MASFQGNQRSERYLTKKLIVDHPPSRKHLLSTCPHIEPSIVSVSHVTRVMSRDMMCPRDSVTTFCLTWLHIWGLYSYKPPRQNISLAISSVLAITSDHNTCRTCLFRFTVQKCLRTFNFTTQSCHDLLTPVGESLVSVVVTQCCHDYSLPDLSALSESSVWQVSCLPLFTQ